MLEDEQIDDIVTTVGKRLTEMFNNNIGNTLSEELAQGLYYKISVHTRDTLINYRTLSGDLGSQQGSTNYDDILLNDEEQSNAQ